MQQTNASEFIYSVEDGDLVVRRADEIVWRGRPSAMSVAEVLAVPGTEDALVRLEDDLIERPRRFPNVIRCRHDGSVMWEGELPQDPFSSVESGAADSYVSIWSDGAELGATSRSCYSVRFDLNSGRISRKVFVK